ncbi:MAG: hypothetical protein FJ184_02055 [Gammaproteobacteria bacterium]|nr:hypothetical protein [Gammaproteobacteria bacterium]
MTTDLRSDLDTALREGKSPKQFAHDHGISVSWTSRLSWQLGWRAMHLSAGERRLIKQLRASAK